ncbi:hypothetical protein [Ancylobacter aquaticus]|nr:hypothetical protein [Ancylobacter aquaticus]
MASKKEPPSGKGSGRRSSGGVPTIRVTKFGGVQIGPREPSGPVTIEEWRRMLVICARLVDEFGESALPLFERCEREIAEAESKSSAMARAKAVLEGREPRKPTDPEPA